MQKWTWQRWRAAPDLSRWHSAYFSGREHGLVGLCIKTDLTLNSENSAGAGHCDCNPWPLGCGQFSSVTQSRPTLCHPWTAACQASLSITNSRSLLKVMSIELVMPSNHFILCCSFLLPPLISASIWVFPNESALYIRWLKYRSFSFSISPSNEYLQMISFRLDWFVLLAVQGTLKSLLHHHTQFKEINSLVLSLLYGPLSHSCMTTGKIIALNIWVFISKGMSCFLICWQGLS